MRAVRTQLQLYIVSLYNIPWSWSSADQAQVSENRLCIRFREPICHSRETKQGKNNNKSIKRNKRRKKTKQIPSGAHKKTIPIFYVYIFSASSAVGNDIIPNKFDWNSRPKLLLFYFWIFAVYNVCIYLSLCCLDG